MSKEISLPKGVIRNPLTVIAVFAGLAEVSATIALPQLSEQIQPIFVWFVMLFPTFLVALFFFILWGRHHVLYAPSDFLNEENFMRHWQKASLPSHGDSEEVTDEILDRSDETGEPSENGSEAARIPTQSTVDIATRIAEMRVAEDLVISKLSRDLNLAFTRDVELSGRSDIRYDAIAQGPSGPVLVEVKLLRSATHAVLIMKREIERAAAVTYRLPSIELKGGRIIFAFVLREEISKEKLLGIKQRIIALREEASLPILVEFEFFLLDDLKKGK